MAERYFAFEDGVRTGTKKRTGEVEITYAQYQEAIDAMTSGQLITVAGGFRAVDKPQPEDEEQEEPNAIH